MNMITIASHSDGEFEDLCRGGHVERTGLIKASKKASCKRSREAYWRGDETRPQLQRIYGIGLGELKGEKLEEEHLDLESSGCRCESDHRRLGRDARPKDKGRTKNYSLRQPFLPA